MKNIWLILSVILILGDTLLFIVPIVPIAYEEAYEIQVPYDVEVPQTTVENLTSGVIYKTDITIARKYIYDVDYLPEGRHVKFWIKSYEPLNIYVFTEPNFHHFVRARASESSEVTDALYYVLNTKDAMIKFDTTWDGIYYFVIYNPYGSEVRTYRKGFVYWWEEEFTTYENKIEYRTETRYKILTKKVSLWSLFTQSY